MAIKSLFFYCKYWKPHVSSSIRSWDISFLSLGQSTSKSTFESPSETMLGTLVSHYSLKSGDCRSSHWLSMVFSLANHVRLTSCCCIHPSVVSVVRGGFSLKIKEIRHRWVCKRSIWPCMAWFHGILLVWHPSY